MTVTSTQPAAAPDGGLVDRVGLAVRRAAESLDATCLLESRQGTILAHAVAGVPAPQVVDAVLTRSSLPLQDAITSRRTVAVLPGGGVQSFRLGAGVPALTVPLVAAGVALGWLWVLPSSRRTVHADAMADAAGDVASAAAACLLVDEPSVGDLLAGRSEARLPSGMQGGCQLWVAAVRAADEVPLEAVGALLELATRRAGPGLPGVVVAVAMESQHLLISARSALAPEGVASLVERVIARSEVPLRAGLGDPVTDVVDLPRARSQADAALDVSRPGRCAQLHSVRSEIVLRAAYASLRELPDLGRDPLNDLLAYDSRRRSAFAETLLAWLDCAGDHVAAATRAGLHHNTVRYRVRRAIEILGVSLDDPAVRLEVHLRLRAAAPGRPAP